MDESEKKALFRRIVGTVPEDLLLDRMRLYGYWPDTVDIPPDPPNEAAERKKIEAEIHQLHDQHAISQDPQKALAAERKRRWEESKARRKQNKKLREQKSKERREAWQAHRQTTLVSAGSGVSDKLQEQQSDVNELSRRGLPVMHTATDLATLLAIPLGKLRWLTYHRRGATLVHYHRFDIPKKTGGRRNISAPKRTLAEAQQKILDTILARVPVEAEAHGFVAKRSILTNASPHAGRQVVINVDLKDFFPSVTFARVRGMFAKLGYSGHAATLMALICTEPPRVKTELEGKTYYIAIGDRALPQGACTSPAITNIISRRLDRRLAGLAKKHSFTYTRYADDLTFSGDFPKKAGRLLRSIRSILTDEGFSENAQKTRVMRKSQRQEVTGLTVNNQKPRLSRKERRQLRAILHNAAQKGLASQNRDDHPNFASYLRGRVAYLRMVEPERADLWMAALNRALDNKGS